MATSTEIKQRANTLADKTDVNSITPKEVGGIMYDLASHGENVLRNGGTLGIRKVYESVAAMEADSTNPKDFWGDPIKKGNLVVIYDGTTTGVDNNKIYAFMKPGWELATKLDAAYATKAETDAKLAELGSEVDELQSKAKGISYFKDYISKGVNINTFFKELYIEGLDENTEYCLRTLRYNPDVNTYQINIGTSEKSVIELNFSVAESENYVTVKRDSVRAFMVIANTDYFDKTSDYLFKNVDTSLTTLDISKVSDISLSPYIANTLLKDEYRADYKDNALKELYVVGSSEKRLRFEVKKKTDGNVYLRLINDSGAVVSYVRLAEDKCNDVILLKQHENSGVSAYAVLDVKKIPLDDDNYYRYKLEWDYFNLSLNPRISESIELDRIEPIIEDCSNKINSPLKEMYVLSSIIDNYSFYVKKKSDNLLYCRIIDSARNIVAAITVPFANAKNVIYIKEHESSGVNGYVVVDFEKLVLDDDNYYTYNPLYDVFNLSVNPRICEYLNQIENEKNLNALRLIKPKYFASDLDVYFKELYIEGLDDNTEYCLRTFGWNSNGYFQINIGNSNGNVIELPIFNGNFAYREKDGIKAWVVLQNIENINSYLIFANSDVEKTKLNKVNATTLSQSPYIKEKIEEEHKEEYLLPTSYNGYSLPKNPASLKILSIGNSFADQPLSTLIKWLNNLGITQVTYGIVSKAGGTLEQHYNGLYTTYDAYFRTTENKDGVQQDWVYSNPETKEVGTIQIKLIDAFSYTDWDVITFHQQSGNSGKWETIEPYLPKLIEAARYYCPNAGVKIAWQQTWAFAKGYSGLSAYGTQEDMFDKIVECSKKVALNYGIDLIIPNGVVMQNLRSVPNSFWGENLASIKGNNEWTSSNPSADFCEDGLHPNGFAEYCLGATFVQVLINSCFNKTIRNSNLIIGYAWGNSAKVARQCVLKAVSNRFSLSEINITDKLE